MIRAGNGNARDLSSSTATIQQNASYNYNPSRNGFSPSSIASGFKHEAQTPYFDQMDEE